MSEARGDGERSLRGDTGDGIEALLKHLRRHPGLLDRLELPNDVRLSVEAALQAPRTSAPGLDEGDLDRIWDRLRADATAEAAAARNEEPSGTS